METHSDETTGPAAGAETVLVVEDDVDVLDFVRDVLEAAGYRVLTAMTAADAIALSEADPSPIHLLLRDLVLSDLARAVEAGVRFENFERVAGDIGEDRADGAGKIRCDWRGNYRR